MRSGVNNLPQCTKLCLLSFSVIDQRPALSWESKCTLIFLRKMLKWANTKTAQRENSTADSAIIINGCWCQGCVLLHWALFIYLKPQEQLKSNLLTCKLHLSLAKYKLLFKMLKRKKEKQHIFNDRGLKELLGKFCHFPACHSWTVDTWQRRRPEALALCVCVCNC